MCRFSSFEPDPQLRKMAVNLYVAEMSFFRVQFQLCMHMQNGTSCCQETEGLKAMGVCLCVCVWFIEAEEDPGSWILRRILAIQKQDVLLYNLDPLRIMHCHIKKTELNKECSRINVYISANLSQFKYNLSFV